jgi:hypothetical protein
VIPLENRFDGKPRFRLKYPDLWCEDFDIAPGHYGYILQCADKPDDTKENPTWYVLYRYNRFEMPKPGPVSKANPPASRDAAIRFLIARTNKNKEHHRVP